jgi:hypothetical protein
MARAIQTTFVGLFLGFLSTAMFLATFIIAGDVLIAATVGVGVAIAQFFMPTGNHQKIGILIWASLALVITLTGLTLSGDEADAAAAPMTVSQSSYMTPACACHGKSQLEASAVVLPKL